MKSSKLVPIHSLAFLKAIPISKPLIFLLVFSSISSGVNAQSGEIFKLCRALSGPILPDEPTLCESITDFVPDKVIRHNTYASNLSYPVWPYWDTDFNGIDVIIEGTFYIDEPVCFKDCRIRMMSGAQIIVTEESFLNELLAMNSKFFSCDDMWKSITLESNTRCRIYSCQIEDAQYALVVGQTVKLALYNNDFNRNFVSITNANGNSTLPFLLFKQNTFDCTSELSDYYYLNFPNFVEDMVSFAGILLRDCSSNIGVEGSNNEFNNLNYGILAENSSISVLGCTFNDAQHTTIIADLIEDDPTEGCGILGLNSTVIVAGSSNATSCVFNNADLLARGSNLYVTYAEFNEASLASSNNENGESITIEDNTFDGVDRYSSISVVRSMASGFEPHTSITRCTIQNFDTDVYPLFAIHINGVNMPTDYAYVSDNVINFSGVPSTGIRFTAANSENNFILNNKINWVSTDENMVGIYAHLGRAKGSKIGSNDIIGGTTLEEVIPTYGIEARSVQGIQFCDNTIDFAGHGMWFWGNCNNSHITLNTLHNLGVGLSLHNYNGLPGQFGVQDATLNIWENENDYILNSAINESSSSLDDNRYIVKSSDASNLRINPTNVLPAFDWFSPIGSSYHGCNGIGDPIINAIDSLVITSETAYDTLAEPVKFYLKKGVIRKIIEEGLESTYSTYLTSVSSSSEYILANVENDLKAAFQMDLTDQSDLDDLFGSMIVLFDSISVYDSIHNATFNPYILTAATNFDSIQSKLEQISTLCSLQQSIKSTRMTLLATELEAIEEDLNSLTPRADFDSDYKTIYLLHIKKIVEGHLDAGDYEDLVDIAQNESDSSFANTTAFAYFDLCDANPFPGYSKPQSTASPIEQMVIQETALFGEKEIETLLITKNNYLNFNPVFDGYISVFDLSGRRVLFKNFKSGSNELNLGNSLVSGVYYYTIFNNSNNLIYRSGVLPVFK